MIPVVAIVGRPNVGKSSLFNRLVGKRKAIESEIAGTTRDVVSQRITFLNQEMILVDTGGLELDAEGGSIEEDVQAQARAAIVGSDLVVLVLDVRQDPTSGDFHAVELLRKSGKPCIVVANKADNQPSLEERAFNFYELGFGEPIAVSAIHGTGIDLLHERVEQHLTELGFNAVPEPKTDGLRLCFVGRPNVGKSSLVNALFGKEKVIVSEIPGTTRDAVEIPFEYEGAHFILVDTAGIRRRGRIDAGIEKFSVMRSFQAIADSDVVVLVVDAEEGLKSQDLHVCEFVLQESKGLIVVVNKMDVFEDYEKNKDRIAHKLQHRMAFVPWAPVVFTSALERRNLFPILQLARSIGEERVRSLTPQEINIWLAEAVLQHSLAGGVAGQRTEVLRGKQVGIRPPRFVFEAKFPDRMHFSYRRYLENSLREHFGFEGTAVKISFVKPRG